MTRTWAEIDLPALRRNAHAFRGVLGDAKLIAVVKANAYGHGAVPAARALAPDADLFAVATPDEALELRRASITHPILILHGLAPGAFEPAIEADAELAISNLDEARLADEAAQRQGRVVRVHVEVDSGMNRSGADPAELPKLIAFCRSADHLEIEALWTHFASADDPAETFTLEQYASFVAATQSVSGGPWVRHAANTGAILNLPKTALDAARIGIGLYGVYPDQATARSLALDPVLVWKARVTQVQDLAPGEAVSYGRAFTATRPMRIATVSVGYGDGYPRRVSGQGWILLHGRRSAVLGNVCMDTLVCDVTDIAEVRYGDAATLIGTDGDEGVTASDVASWTGTILYEVLTRVGTRVRRHYVE